MHAHLRDLATSVADGSQVDWDQAEGSAGTEEERKVIRQLRSLSQVAALARADATWGPLQLRGDVGSGAFGTVYRAWDTRLEREVALKLLDRMAPDEATASALIKEGRLLAQLRHPNVVTVYGADVFEGRAGVWMEFISGRTLKTLVVEQGPLGAAEAGMIGRDLCRALAAVHQRGFVHRDIKAQNVMRELGGRTVLMDFGAGHDAQGPEQLALRGTPAYLAPELLAGGQATARTDIYSLGVLLYYLVSGGFPVMASSLDQFRTHHAEGRRVLLRDARPDLPAEFVRAIDACLAPVPAERPESAGAVEAMLEQALGLRTAEPAAGISAPRPSMATRWVAAVATIAVLAGGAWLATRRPAAPMTAARDSVAILPFLNLTGSTDDDYFSEGITADLVASLSSLRDLRVIAGPSLRAYANRKTSPVDIGTTLGVATVLDASVRRSDERVRIVTQLIDARTGDQIWSESFDRPLADFQSLRSDVANRIAVALKGELSQQDMALLNPGRTYNNDAFNAYMRGRHFVELRTEPAVTRSLQYFHDALGHDPTFAPAYAGIADAYMMLGVWAVIPREEANARAIEAAQKAVSLDDTLAEAHSSLAYANKNRLQWAEAERGFKRALELKPSLASAHHRYSIFLTQHGRFAEAITEIRLAMSLDPLSAAPRLQLAALLIMARRYDDAIAQYREALTLDGGLALAYRHLANAYARKGDFPQAQAAFDEYQRRSPVAAEDQEFKADLGYFYAASGRRTDALAIAKELTARYQSAGEAVGGSIAAIYASLHQRAEALDWLDRAVSTKDPEVGYLLVDSKWDPIRDEPRFQQTLKALGFTPKPKE